MARTDISSDSSPLVEGLLTIHKVITHGLKTSITKCDEYLVKQGIPSEESAGYFMYLRALKYITHSHHLSEDEIAFPYLKDNIDAPYNRLTKDHHDINIILEKLDKCLSEVSPESQNNIKHLRGLLGEFEKVWHPHIKIEEENFNPEKLHAVVGIKEELLLVEKLGEHGRKTMGPGPIILPFIFYNLDGRERDTFLKPIPWFVKKLLVPIVWRKQWKPMSPFLLLQSN